jgi:hypothetical protein
MGYVQAGLEMPTTSGIACSVAGAALVATLLVHPAHASTVISFEVPVVSGGYQYSSNSPYSDSNGTFTSPTAEGVNFSGMSGIQANGSAWGFTNAPDGNQTAFLQTQYFFPADPGSIAFSFAGLSLTDPNYDLVFYVEGRPTTGGTFFTVTANGIPKLFGPPSTSSWTQEVVPFSALSGANFTIAINAPTVVTDNSIGVDDVFVVATPLPSTWLMLFGGLVGFSFFAVRGNTKNANASAAA